jgi:hypothetical protein
MKHDFTGAAVRHFDDAKLLLKDARTANADQLFGFAAECALKSALVGLPAFRNGEELARRYWEHISQLWHLVLPSSVCRRHRALATVLTSLRGSFDDWSTSQRYAADGEIEAGAAQRHGDVAKRLLGSVGLLGRRREE